MWVFEFEPNAPEAYERGRTYRPRRDRFGDWLTDDSQQTHTLAVVGAQRPLVRPKVQDVEPQPSVAIDLPDFPGGTTKVWQGADGTFSCHHEFPEAFVRGAQTFRGATGGGESPEAAVQQCVGMVKKTLADE